MTKSIDRPIRAVVFDLDGTLIDSERVFVEAARRLLALRGKVVEVEFLATMQGTPGRDALPRFRDRYELTESIEEITVEYRKHFYDALDGALPGLMPGAREFLERLEANGIPKAIATSSRLHYVEKVFVPLGLMAHFDFVLTADDVTHGKPDPEIYRKAAERSGMPTSDVLVIEDSIAGLRSAIAAGLPCVVVPHEATPRGQLIGARAVVSSLSDSKLWDCLGLHLAPGH
jgi:HAD superfamily hydrolase (TIGR01509 family)